jgi:transposase
MAEITTHRRWTPEEKLRVIQEARQTNQSISNVCRQYGIAVGQFYQWEKQAKQGALTGLRNSKRGRRPADPTTALQAEVQCLHAVVTELATENLQLKRGLWPEPLITGTALTRKH